MIKLNFHRKAKSRLERTYVRRNHGKNILLGVGIGINLIAGGLISTILAQPQLDDSPIIEREARAAEVVIVYRDSEKQEVTENQAIINYISEVFGDRAGEAITVAQCESELDPLRVGDTNLMVHRDGEVVGDSIGVFQIRTGGDDFNRAKANGMTADEFREKLKDWKYNIEYAKTIFDRSGWGPWTCTPNAIKK